MDQYSLQSYFKGVCKSYWIAYREREKTSLNDEQTDLPSWEGKVMRMEAELYATLTEMCKKDYKVIVTEKDEAMFILKFLKKYGKEYFKVVNVDDEFSQVFPRDDEICERFYEACYYAIENEIERLYKTVYGNK